MPAVALVLPTLAVVDAGPVILLAAVDQSMGVPGPAPTLLALFCWFVWWNAGCRAGAFQDGTVLLLFARWGWRGVCEKGGFVEVEVRVEGVGCKVDREFMAFMSGVIEPAPVVGAVFVVVDHEKRGALLLFVGMLLRPDMGRCWAVPAPSVGREDEAEGVEPPQPALKRSVSVPLASFLPVTNDSKSVSSAPFTPPFIIPFIPPALPLSIASHPPAATLDAPPAELWLAESSCNLRDCSFSMRVDNDFIRDMKARNCCRLRSGPRENDHSVGRTWRARKSESATRPTCWKTERAAICG